jgi:glyoxylase-like metal-dependent hydrolase (beta-lactamase superfamily II)
LSDVDLAPGHPEIARIVAPNPGPMTLQGTNTYLLGTDPCLVIDPGPADRSHVDAIGEAAAGRGGIGGVLLTHGHDDHAAGAALLEAEVLELADGQSRGAVTAIATPGHAIDHLCFLSDGVCFSGDLVLGEGSTIVPPDAGSLVAYLESLRRLQGLDLELICPGHGPWVTDPAAKIEEYIEHRMMRERRLRAALERGERSRSALLAEVWDDVPQQLRPAAAAVMAAHLDKLRSEGLNVGALKD